MKVYTLEEWRKEGEELFKTKDLMEWEFICPNCKTLQRGKDLMELGLSKEEAQTYFAFSCIGRFTQDLGCDWTLGGLLQIHSAVIIHDGEERPIFTFANNRIPKKKIRPDLPPNITFERKNNTRPYRVRFYDKKTKETFFVGRFKTEEEAREAQKNYKVKRGD